MAKRVRDEYDVDGALQLIRESSKAKFDETLEVALQLGVDPRKPGQNVRGVVSLPHGTGKKVRIAVFARGAKAQEALDAGAAIVGAEDLVEQITSGVVDFDKCIATPDVMPLVGRVARILGPKGLMPNPKLGSVTMDVAGAIEAATHGQAEYRVERRGIVHAGVGKLSFSDQQLKENLRAFMIAISNAKPEVMKGQFFRHVTMSSTMGPGVAVEMVYLNPAHVRFMQPSSLFAGIAK